MSDLASSPITPTIDLDAPGASHGFLRLPHSRDDSAWGNVIIPIAVLRGGTGPTVAPQRRAFSVSGGKGGVGKSTIALNLALSYAQQGLRTLMVDTDLGMADLNLLLGVAPERSLLDALGGTPIEDIIVSAHGLDLLPALNGSYLLSTIGSTGYVYPTELGEPCSFDDFPSDLQEGTVGVKVKIRYPMVLNNGSGEYGFNAELAPPLTAALTRIDPMTFDRCQGLVDGSTELTAKSWYLGTTPSGGAPVRLSSPSRTESCRVGPPPTGGSSSSPRAACS